MAEDYDILDISEAVQDVLAEKFNIQFYGADSEQGHLALDIGELIMKHEIKQSQQPTESEG